MNHQTLLLILIDAWRWDKLHPHLTPFLSSLSSTSYQGVLEEPLGFIPRPAFLAGLLPDQSQLMTMYKFTTQSPTGLLGKLLASLPSASSLKPHFLTHALITKTRSNKIAKGELLGARILHPYHIPLSLWPHIDTAENFRCDHPQYLPKHSTIFDVLRSAQLNWLYLGYPDSDLRTPSIIKNFYAQFHGQKLIFLHFAETDWTAHQSGPHSHQYHQSLQQIDTAIADIFHYLQKNHFRPHLIAFGDHGCVTVQSTVDIWTLLQNSPWKLGKHYLVFLDSTMARFKFFHPPCQKNILQLLDRQSSGKWLTSQEKTYYGLNFPHHDYGSHFWVLTQPHLILPNFFQTSPITAVHGYPREIANNHAALLIHPRPTLSPASHIHLKALYPLTKQLIKSFI